MKMGNPHVKRRRYLVSRILAVILAFGVMSDLPPASAALPDPTFTVPGTGITAIEQTPVQVFPGLLFVDSGTNYSGEWIEYSIDSSTAADRLFLETATVASTTLDSITVVGSTIFRGNGGSPASASAIGTIDSVKNGQNGNNLRVTFTNTFTNGDFSTNTQSVVGDVVSLSGWTAYKRRVKLGGASTVEGFATPVDNAFPATTDPTTNNDQSTDSNSFSVNPSYAGRSGGGYSVQLSTNGNCGNGYCIIRGPYIVSNSPVYLQAGDSVSFWWSAIGASDAYDVYGYLLNTATGSTIQLLNSTGANAAATQAWTQVTRNINSGEEGSYKFVFVAGTWDATGGQAEGASLLLDDVNVTSSAGGTITASNLRDLSLLLRYVVTNDAPLTSRVARIATFNGAVDGVQNINNTPVNDPIALQDPGSITRLRDMSDSSTAFGNLLAFDPDTGTGTSVPADYRITGGVDNPDSRTSTFAGTYGVLTITDTATGAYNYDFYDTLTALSVDSYETFTVTAFDGVFTATGQLRIELLGTLPAGQARTIAFTVPSPLTLSRNYGDTFTVTAVPSLGVGNGTITYSVGASTACSVSGNTVTITAGTGTCTVTSTISAGTTHAAATTTSNVVVTVAKRPLTVNGASQEMIYGSGEPNLGAYALVGTLAGSDAITVTGARLSSILTGVTPVGLTVVFSSGSLANYDLTVNNGSLIVNPGRASGPYFGEPVRQLGGYTVVINNFDPSVPYTISVPSGAVTIVGTVNGVYSAVVTGIIEDVTIDLVSSRPGYVSEFRNTRSGPLYIQTITLDLSSLEKIVPGISRVLTPLTSIKPEGEGVTYISLTPAICEVKLDVMVYALSVGTCTIKAVGNPSPRVQAGASATSAFKIVAPPKIDTAVPTPTPTPTPPTTNLTTKTCQALGTVYFDTDSSKLSAATLKALAKTVELLKTSGSGNVCIVGFTDSRASIAYNLALSKRRVDAVYKYLIGVLTEQTISRDFKGKANPVAVNDAPTKGMAKNRRVEIGIQR